jgi:hypothetical protein
MLKPSMAGASSRRGSAGPDQEMLVPITRLPIVAANIYTNNDHKSITVPVPYMAKVSGSILFDEQ